MTRATCAGLIAGLLAHVLVNTAIAEPQTPAPRRPDTTANTQSQGGAPRRLDDVFIEGEIPVPQVLFITTRDQRRFMDFHHQRYLRTSLELGRATALPVWSTVNPARPISTKETQR